MLQNTISVGGQAATCKEGVVGQFDGAVSARRYAPFLDLKITHVIIIKTKERVKNE